MTEMTPETVEVIDKPKPGIFRSMRNSLITGVIIALPIGATVWLITSFVRFVDNFVLKILPAAWNPNTYISELIGFNLPGTGLIFAVLALFVLGVLASNFIGNGILRFGENLLGRVPFVSNIYSGVKQIVSTVAQSEERTFDEVCLLEYPRPGLWAVGFITAKLRGAPLKHLSDDFVCVFVPTTPNPTSGFLLFSKRSDLKILDMTPEEGAKMIISGGLVSNEEKAELPEKKPNRLSSSRRPNPARTNKAD